MFKKLCFSKICPKPSKGGLKYIALAKYISTFAAKLFSCVTQTAKGHFKVIKF